MPPSPRRAFTQSLFIVLAVCIALSHPRLMASTPPTFRIVTGPQCVEGEPKTDLASAFTQGVAFSARPLSVEEWEGRLQKREPGAGGLFRGSDGRPAPFQVFLLSIQNQSKELVRFQPGNVVRLGGPTEEDHILDYTDLYRYLSGIGKPGEDLDPVRDEFFDSGLILEPGKPIERLLFFREMPPSKKRKMMMLLVSSFQVGTETYQAGMAWHFEKEK